MPRIIRNFAEGEYYHLSLRRAGEEEMFLDQSDYYRGIFSLFEFNSQRSVTIQKQRQKKKNSRGRPSMRKESTVIFVLLVECREAKRKYLRDPVVLPLLSERKRLIEDCSALPFCAKAMNK